MTRFPGARWWKFDFHAHTPASKDYGKGPDQERLLALAPEEWLLQYMRAGVDCVAITDHNTGAWIDHLKAALADLKRAGHADYRPLYLFPGVELTANSGIHILGIFAPSAGSDDITRLLGAVRAKAEPGSSDAACDKAAIEVISEIAAAGGIPVLAHVDEPKGLFAAEIPGNTLGPILDLPSLFAMEVRDTDADKPALYTEKQIAWAEVLGSDSHHPDDSGDRYPGSHFTWVKMGEPDLEGVRLALLDNAPLSIRRSDEAGGDPNSCASLFIEKLKVEDARYCGRGTALVTAFNPWLNAIIGGRGSGKSSIVEFSRIVLQREDELPETLATAFGEFNQVPVTRESRGALTADTKINAMVRKDGTRYLVQWSQDGTAQPIMEELEDGTWQEAPGDVRQRFPVRIFSQKQVYALAEEGGALLRIVDETSEVDRSTWDDRWTTEHSNYLSLKSKGRALFARLGEEEKLKGELHDVLKKLTIFETAEHARLLKEYQLRERQFQAMEGLVTSLTSHQETLRRVAEQITSPLFDNSLFNLDDSGDAGALRWADDTAAGIRELAARVYELHEAAGAKKEEARASLERLEWAQRRADTRAAYQQLVQTLRDQGVVDINQYGVLVEQRQSLEDRLRTMMRIREELEVIRQEAQTSFESLTALRLELTELRGAFLQQALGGNRHVRIKVQPLGRSRREAEVQFRDLIGRSDGFAADILSEDRQAGLVAALYDGLPENGEGIYGRLEDLKREMSRCIMGRDDTRFGARFAKYLRQLQPEILDRIRCWFPEDTLSVEYSPKGNGRDFKPLQQGSPGQKTAAILAFILAQGSEPIILDQPEDDLDNQLIYDLIVSQIRENKVRRQVIVITHNPNIVVNGDAEAVFALDQRAGQCRIVAHGCLQSIAVRDEVCRIMEGGREAFEKRYRRIIATG